jgi:ABC-type branched-subunit amino acid transport system substrate-binding protein
MRTSFFISEQQPRDTLVLISPSNQGERRMSKTIGRAVVVLLSLTLVAAACTEDDPDDATTATTAGSSTESTEGGGDTETTEGGEAVEIDYEALGLWDDGPCDAALPPLEIGLMTVFESPLLSLEDQAIALEASAEAFNSRGGANGACIEVTTCDDGADPNQALDCVRTLDDAGVVATVNDQGTTAQADVSAAMAAAGIPRVASNVVFDDSTDQNAFPLDSSGTGVTFLLPQALIDVGVSDIAIIRVDLASAGQLLGIIEGIYEGEATFVADTPVPSGTTDYSQFIIGAQDAGASGAYLALGEQEAVQVVRAAQQLGTDLTIGASLGTFPHASITDLGDFADQMVVLGPYPPATFDLPVYEALRADLAASGEEALQPANLKSSPMRSWIGLYALLYMLREDGTTDFTREGIRATLEAATDVPMLGIFGDATWTPDTDHAGLFQRAGIPDWFVFSWDADAEAPDGLEGNFVQESTINFDEVLCGSPLGAPEPC